MTEKYRSSTVRNLLQTDLISAKTKEVLNNRLEELDEKYEPAFLNSSSFKTLQAICDRLIPQSNNRKYVDLASSIDRRLAEGKSDGWRYAFMPQDGECYKLALDAIDETSIGNYSRPFIELTQTQQNNLLLYVQQGKVSGNSWKKVSAHHFFQELLAELTEAYYSHPLGQEEIGYVGMADTHGWKAIGLNKLDQQEPREER
jgi:gluconate 2-dehydrogenase gamma chain